MLPRRGANAPNPIAGELEIQKINNRILGFPQETPPIITPQEDHQVLAFGTLEALLINIRDYNEAYAAVQSIDIFENHHGFNSALQVLHKTGKDLKVIGSYLKCANLVDEGWESSAGVKQLLNPDKIDPLAIGFKMFQKSLYGDQNEDPSKKAEMEQLRKEKINKALREEIKSMFCGSSADAAATATATATSSTSNAMASGAAFAGFKRPIDTKGKSVSVKRSLPSQSDTTSQDPKKGIQPAEPPKTQPAKKQRATRATSALSTTLKNGGPSNTSLKTPRQESITATASEPSSSKVPAKRGRKELVENPTDEEASKSEAPSKRRKAAGEQSKGKEPVRDEQEPTEQVSSEEDA